MMGPLGTHVRFTILPYDFKGFLYGRICMGGWGSLSQAQDGRYEVTSYIRGVS